MGNTIESILGKYMKNEDYFVCIEHSDDLVFGFLNASLCFNYDCTGRLCGLVGGAGFQW